jgi:hypothetical protein
MTAYELAARIVGDVTLVAMVWVFAGCPWPGRRRR